jgi:threonine/homoserine/homoserine lactone efflux protein
MGADVLFIFAISIALLYIKPGPNQAMKITKTLNDGYMPAWVFTLGATSTVIFYFVIACLGTDIIQTLVGASGFYFKIIGGAYLIYMGYKGLSNIEKGVWNDTQKTGAAKSNLMGSYGLGVLMTLGNPITIFYFIGIIPTFMTMGELGLDDIAVGVGIIILVGNIADLLLITLVNQVKTALTETRFVRCINVFASVGFVLIGSFLIFSAITNGQGGFSI